MTKPNQTQTPAGATLPAFKPSSVLIFEEADGYHYSARASEFLDARGTGYRSRAAAMRAARESHESQVRISGTSCFC